MYAIIDLETTGGQFNKEGITEIAIYRFNGVDIVDQFISLVNPEIPIQPFVVKLTGINNAMLRQAPKFYEVAKRIVEITEGCIIVAHNASFDYRILKLEFDRLGYQYNKPTLCTVEMSKILLPNAASYSLGKLVRSLGIPIPDRHRANGDALATLKLFKLLLDKDSQKQIVKQQIKHELHQGISPKLFDILQNIPPTVGVFYVHNDKGIIIYINKGTNMRKKLNSIFTSDSKLATRIQKEVYTVTYEETGNELIALLKEREELFHNKPTLNKTQKKSLFLWSVYRDKSPEGYLTLKIQKSDGRKQAIQSFKNPEKALKFINDLYKQNEIVENVQSKLNLELNQQFPVEMHNELFKNIIDKEVQCWQNMIIILKGRNQTEKSALLIEKGIFKGYCFFELNYQITNVNVLNSKLITLNYTKDTFNIVKQYITSKNDYKIILF